MNFIDIVDYYEMFHRINKHWIVALSATNAFDEDESRIYVLRLRGDLAIDLRATEAKRIIAEVLND